MTAKLPRNVKRRVANVFGSFGYVFCLLQWFWAVLLYFSVVQSAISFTLSTNDAQPAPAAHPAVTIPSQLETGLVIVVAIVIAVMTLYALIKAPGNIARTGSRVVHQTTDVLAPIVIKAQHKKDTQKSRRSIAPKLMVVVKAVISIIPILLGVFAGLLDALPIDYSIAVIVSIGLGGVSILFFLIQYVLARLLRVKKSELW